MIARIRQLSDVKPSEGASAAYRNLFEARSERAARVLDRFPFEFHQRGFEMCLGGRSSSGGTSR